MIASVAAIVFAVVTSVGVGFQLALALGAPWGAYAMGGRSLCCREPGSCSLNGRAYQRGRCGWLSPSAPLRLYSTR
jgi:hypothetical protein